MPYQPNDIVMLRLEAGAGVYAILRPHPASLNESYLMVKLDKGPLTKEWIIPAASILARIGTLEPDALKLDPADQITAQGNWEKGQRFARFMAQECPLPEDRMRWAVLANLKPGDAIVLYATSRRARHLELHRFIEVLPNGQKYIFSAVNAKGTVYRYPLKAIALTTGHAQSPANPSQSIPPAPPQLPQGPPNPPATD